MIGAVLFPYLILTSIRFYFIDAIAVVVVDWILMNLCILLPDTTFFRLTAREMILLNSIYVGLSLVSAYQCYLDESRRRLYFLQCRRYRVLFSLACSVCDDMLPNAEVGSNTRSEKQNIIDPASSIASFRPYVNTALGSIPTRSSLSASCIVVGIDSLGSILQHRSPAQSVSLLSKIHETIVTTLKRSVAEPDLQISCVGSGHGALLIAYIGLGAAPQCDSALEMCRVALRLAELSDPRTSQQLFGVMLTISIGIDSGRLIHGPIPCWDVADDDIVPPGIYSAVLGEAIQGARIAQTLADQGQICIGKATYDRIRHLYEAEPVCPSATSTPPKHASTTDSSKTSLATEIAALQYEHVDELSSIIALLRVGLQIRHRKRFFRTVPNCFSGSEMVDLLLSSQRVLSRFDAVARQRSRHAQCYRARCEGRARIFR